MYDKLNYNMQSPNFDMSINIASFLASFPVLPYFFCSLVCDQYNKKVEEWRKMGKACKHLPCDMDGRLT